MKNVDKKLLIAVENIMALVCFTILAIVFKNFWLIFVSLVFVVLFWASTDTFTEDEKCKKK